MARQQAAAETTRGGRSGRRLGGGLHAHVAGAAAALGEGDATCSDMESSAARYMARQVERQGECYLVVCARCHELWKCILFAAVVVRGWPALRLPCCCCAQLVALAVIIHARSAMGSPRVRSAPRKRRERVVARCLVSVGLRLARASHSLSLIHISEPTRPY